MGWTSFVIICFHHHRCSVEFQLFTYIFFPHLLILFLSLGFLSDSDFPPSPGTMRSLGNQPNSATTQTLFSAYFFKNLPFFCLFFSGALQLRLEQEREAQFGSQRRGLYPQVQPGENSSSRLEGEAVVWYKTVLQLPSPNHHVAKSPC